MEKKLESEVPATPAPRKGKKPWEMTIEEAEAEGERLRARRVEADRLARPLFLKQLADSENPEE